MADEVKDANVDEFMNSDAATGDMHDKFSTPDQYTVYKIKKKSGGFRVIEAPNDELKAAQKVALRKLMHCKLLRVSHFAHAFAWGKNVASAAMPHVGQEVVLTTDLTDFFPSVKFDHFDTTVKNTDATKNLRSYRSWAEIVFGKSKVGNAAWRQEYEAEVMPLLKMHFCDFGDGKGLRLPQGAPASPFLSNVLMGRLDYRIAWKAYKEGVQYTRYADDFIFSGADEHKVKAAYARCVALITTINLAMNPRKYTLKKGFQRKKIVGLVVNEKLNTTRFFRRRLRAMRHHCNVLFTLIELGKERGFDIPKNARALLIQKNDKPFGERMKQIVETIQKEGGSITMDDLASKNLKIGPAANKRIMGHMAFQHMVDNPPAEVQSSMDFCAVNEILRMA